METGFSVGLLPIRDALLELRFPEEVLSQLNDDALSRFEGDYGLRKEGDRSGDDMPDGMLKWQDSDGTFCPGRTAGNR